MMARPLDGVSIGLEMRGNGGIVYGKLDVMNPRIREYRDSDEQSVVALSLRAWAPVFASLETVLGTEIFRRLHPDWRADQDKAVQGVLADRVMRLWVAEAAPPPVGFVAELDMFADPEVAVELRAAAAARMIWLTCARRGRVPRPAAGIPRKLVARGFYQPFPTIDDPDQAEAFVTARVAQGSTT